MAPKEKKTKAQISLAAAAASKKGGKKWTTKVKKDKANIACYWDKASVKKISDIAKAKNVTVSTVRDRLQVTGELCKQAILYLEQEGKITPVVKSGGFWLFTSAITTQEE